MSSSTIDVNATVKLISTDNQEMYFEIYHLLSARQASSFPLWRAEPSSAVFRNLLPSCQAPLDLRFTDATIEDGMVLHLFRGQIYGYLMPGADTVSLTALDRLMGFLRKYECQSMIRALLLDLRSYLPRGQDVPGSKHEAAPIEVFTLAAVFASVPICADILAACPPGGEKQWECLDTRFMPVETFERLPARFAWGLMRSMDGSQPMNSAMSWRKAARVFRELMSENGSANAGKCEDTAAARVKARSDRKAKLSSCPYPR